MSGSKLGLRYWVLEAEIIRLKKLNPKPNIKANTKPVGDDNPGGLPLDSDNDDKPESSEENDSLSRKSEVKKSNDATRRQRSQPPRPPVSEEYNRSKYSKAGT